MMFAEELIKEKNPAVIRIGKYLEERAKDDIKIKSTNITKVVSREQKQPKIVKTQPSDTPKPIKKEKVTNTRKKKTDPVEGQISLF